MRQEDEKLADAWDALQGAIQKVVTSLPTTLSERVDRLDDARKEMRDAINAHLARSERGTPETKDARSLADGLRPDMDGDDLRAWAASAAETISALCRTVDGIPKYAVYDWEYELDGVMKYARTPERAAELQRQGTRLTPVYVPEPAPADVPALPLVNGGEPSEAIVEAVADALEKAEFGFSMELTRLVDGVSTYTLTYSDDAPPLEFEYTDDAYDHIAKRRRQTQARAAIAAMAGNGGRKAS